jgi:hypothetical protein
MPHFDKRDSDPKRCIIFIGSAARKKTKVTKARGVILTVTTMRGSYRSAYLSGRPEGM